MFLSDLSSDVASQISVGVIFSLFWLIVIVLTIVLLVIHIKVPTRPKIVMFKRVGFINSKHHKHLS
jgi:hypothetical protein